MNNKFTKLSILTTLLTPALFAQALPGINSKGGGMIMPEGMLKFAYKSISMKRDKIFDGTDEVKNSANLDAKAQAHVLIAGYGIKQGLDIKIAIPYKSVAATAKLGPNDVEIDNSGIGDIIVMTRYALTSMKKDGYLLSIGAGIKLPTGSTDDGFKKAPSFAKDISTPMPTQMGTGEMEYKAELGLTKMYNDLRVDAHTMYTYRPKAERDYDFGDELSFDISIVKPITDKINIGIEYNGKYNSKTDMGDDTNAQLRSMLPFKTFSGVAGYITPQIHIVPFGKPKIHLDLGVSLLVHYNLSEAQPLEKSRIVTRIGYVF